MAYEDALSILAEVAIAITGFSGIVSVFGRRSAGEWSVPERIRLSGLLITSLTALLFCLVPFVLLSIPISESTCWRSLSLLLALLIIGSAARVVPLANEARQIPRSQRETSLALSVFFIAGDFLAAIALLANGFLIGLVWPYLAALIWGLMKAALIFVRLILAPIGRGAAA